MTSHIALVLAVLTSWIHWLLMLCCAGVVCQLVAMFLDLPIMIVFAFGNACLGSFTLGLHIARTLVATMDVEVVCHDD